MSEELPSAEESLRLIASKLGSDRDRLGEDIGESGVRIAVALGQIAEHLEAIRHHIGANGKTPEPSQWVIEQWLHDRGYEWPKKMRSPWDNGVNK